MSEFSVYLNGPDALKGELLRQFSDSFLMKDKILDLNRLVASLKSDNKKLRESIHDLRKAGDVSVVELMEQLAIKDQESFPGSKLAHQRREIANLHKVIGRLKDEIRILREG